VSIIFILLLGCLIYSWLGASGQQGGRPLVDQALKRKAIADIPARLLAGSGGIITVSWGGSSVRLYIGGDGFVVQLDLSFERADAPLPFDCSDWRQVAALVLSRRVAAAGEEGSVHSVYADWLTVAASMLLWLADQFQHHVKPAIRVDGAGGPLAAPTSPPPSRCGPAAAAGPGQPKRLIPSHACSDGNFTPAALPSPPYDGVSLCTQLPSP